VTAPRRISAADTAHNKFFISGLLLVGAVAVAVMIGRLLAIRDWVADRVGTGPMIMLLVAFGTSVLLSLSYFWSESRLKRVALSDTKLHVSNFRRAIVVPLCDVEAVEFVETGIGRVVMTFAHDTAFGRRIIFIPIGFFPGKAHPIMAELRAAVARAKPPA
jgi:hypothetical protein